MAVVKVKKMQPADIEEAAKVLSRAMLSNPIHVAVYHGESEIARQQTEAGFLAMLQTRPEELIMATQESQIIGVCRFFVCHGDRLVSQDVQELIDTSDPDLSSVKNRNDFWHGIWARRDPSLTHCHLGPIGVLPEYQNLGVGSLLMERYCKFVDELKLPAYLETDKSTNVSFYGKFGFKVIDKIRILEVMNYFMWREIQA